MAYKIGRKLLVAIKYLLIKIDKFSFYVYFIVPDNEADTKIPLILGRSFMKTARMLMDIDNG